MFSLLLLDDVTGLPFEELFLEVAGVVERISDGVNGSGGNGVLLSAFVFKLVLEILNEHVDNGSGTLKLEERD